MNATTRPDKDYSVPFKDTDDDEFGEIGSSDCVDNNLPGHENYEKLNLKIFDFTEHKMYEMEHGIDPENTSTITSTAAVRTVQMNNSKAM